MQYWIEPNAIEIGMTKSVSSTNSMIRIIDAQLIDQIDCIMRTMMKITSDTRTTLRAKIKINGCITTKYQPYDSFIWS